MPSVTDPSPVPHPTRLSRRDFLLTLLIPAAAIAVGCTRREDATALPSPSPATAASPVLPAEATALAIDQASLDEFLAVSALLTGFERQDLDPNLGRTYLASLQARPNPDLKLTDFYDRIGYRGAAPPQSLEALAQSGGLDQEKPRTLANKIIEYWYTGIYDGDSGPLVATFRDALAWKSLGFAFAPTTCLGDPGSWASRPAQTVA